MARGLLEEPPCPCFSPVKALRQELKQQEAKFRLRLQEARCAREAALQEVIKQKEAMIRDLTHRLYGKGSEKTGKLQGQSNTGKGAVAFDVKRRRGQQKGSRGHGRTDHSDMPTVDEVILLSENVCPQCKKPYTFLADAASQCIEIQVRAYRRQIRRERCVKNCTCTPDSPLLTAPLPPHLLSKSSYGLSVWEEALLQKFLYAQPAHRILHHFKSLGLHISPGSLAGGLKRLTPLFAPLYQALQAQQMQEDRFHQDETRWFIYEPIVGKAGHQGYLWVTRSSSVIYYWTSPTRGVDTPLTHFARLKSKAVIVVCDRYCVYKKLAKLNTAITLAFCWVHVRRDFLKVVRAPPHLKEWGLDWVDKIANLYHRNQERLTHWNPHLSLTEQSLAFQEKQQGLQSALDAMQAHCCQLLEADDQAKEKGISAPESLIARQRKVLVGLQNHWQGLTVFCTHPEVPMDNNAAEQAIRNPVIGRKNYYGSGSVWSAELAAMLFSILQTLLYCWHLNPRTWLRGYLVACAFNGGKPPSDLSEFLPWQMSEADRQKWVKPPIENTS